MGLVQIRMLEGKTRSGSFAASEESEVSNLMNKADSNSGNAPFGYRFDQVVLELGRGRLVVDEAEVPTPRLPLRLLQAVCEKPGLLLSRNYLFDYIWPHQIVSDEALTKLIGRVRELLGPYGPRLITVRGRGVRLDATVRQVGAPEFMQTEAQGSWTAQIPSIGTDERATVLVVDDAADCLAVLSETLKDQYVTKVATNGPNALKAALRPPLPDLILLDVNMPEMDGYETCARMKNTPELRDIPVIFLTSRSGAEDEARGFAAGAVDYIAKPISPPIVLARVAAHIRLVRIQRELRNQNEHLNALVEIRAQQLTRVQDATILAMAVLADKRGRGGGNHIQRTQNYVRLLACKLIDHPRFRHELNEQSIELLFKSVPLHDIGKVGIPDAILSKQDVLTAEEFETMKLHTVYGGDAIHAVEQHLGESSDFLRFAREIAYSHQERWDGSGYPEGLAGDEIPVSARLMAVADAYDALISGSSGKQALLHEKAVKIIGGGRGTQFDPDVTDAFMQVAGDFSATATRYPTSSAQ